MFAVILKTSKYIITTFELYACIIYKVVMSGQELCNRCDMRVSEI